MEQSASRPYGISHSRDDESMEAKAEWLGSLTPEERLRMLAEWTELVLENNPELTGIKDAIPIEGRVRVLELHKRFLKLT